MTSPMQPTPWVPVPDPTLLTTEQLLREIGQLEKTINLQFLALSAELDGVRNLANARFTASEKAVDAALLSAEKAVEKANLASDKRFENVNEFRAQLSDVIGTMISRVEAETRFNANERRLNEMKSALDKGFSGHAASEDTSRWIKGDRTASYTGYYALAGVGLTIIIIVIAVMNLLTR